MTAEGSINLGKFDQKDQENDQNSALTAKIKKKRQLPEVGGNCLLFKDSWSYFIFANFNFLIFATFEKYS